jgi:S-adenosylmethionine synthetase
MYFRLCENCFIFAIRKWTDLIAPITRAGLQPRKKVLKPMLLFTRSVKLPAFRIINTFINFMPYLFTSESVSEGHPDKVADQISDALIDNFLAFDAESKVACETLVTTGQVILAGEVKSKAYLDVQKIAREVINKIGYTKGEYMFDGSSCGVLSAIHEQSPDINQGVDRQAKEEQGAGDQGMMFGYATVETDNYMPLALDIAHALLIELAAIRRENNEIKYLRPDAKSQVTLEYDDNNSLPALMLL